MEITAQIIFLGAMLISISIFAGMASNRVGAPLLLTFLVVGMLFGEDGPGGILFNDMQAAYFIGSLTLAIILFDGGMRTPLARFRSALWPSFSLATAGVVITAVITGTFAAWLLGLNWAYGMLFGAVLASTDAAAVFLLLHQRGVTLSPHVSATLEVESGLNDPMAIFLTIALVEILRMPEALPLTGILSIFALQLGLGILGGIAGGRATGWILSRVRVAEGLYPILAISLGLLLFSGVSLLGGSGFLAIYLAGLLTGSRLGEKQENVMRFCDGAAWLSQMAMMLMIGLLVTPTLLIPQIVPAIFIALVLTFIARPLAVGASLLPFGYRKREIGYIAWVGLRGGVPIFLAIIPFLSGIEQDRTLFNVAFVVVLISLLLQGSTISMVARWLKLSR